MSINAIINIPALFNILDNADRASLARLNTICSIAFEEYKKNHYSKLEDALKTAQTKYSIPAAIRLHRENENEVNSSQELQGSPPDDPEFQILQLQKKRWEKVKNQPAGVVYLSDKVGKITTEPLLITLGRGGSKEAIALQNGRALLIQNMRLGSASNMWNRIVKEECAMSDFLGSLQLLSPESKKVMISFSPDEKGLLPAYICNSFEELAERGLKIIDCKIPESCTWIEKKDFIFSSDEERFNAKNWDFFLDELLNDVAKICRYKIPVGSDSSNLAIQKSKSHEKFSSFQLRWFGFDFSSKNSALKLPSRDNFLDIIHPEVAGSHLSSFLSLFFYWEFPSSYWSESCITLRAELVERYKNIICERALSL